MEITMVRRRLILGAVAAAATLSVPAVFAQPFPSKPLELVVHTAP